MPLPRFRRPPRPRLRPRAPWSLAAAVLLPLLPLAYGCGGDSIEPEPIVDDDQLYWALDLNHHAVTLTMTEPYNTVTLAATPRNFRGEALATDSLPRYESGDPEHVAVTPDGVVHALAPLGRGTIVTVRARMTVNKVTNVDSVLIQILDNPTPFTMGSLSVQPIAPDSAKQAASQFWPMPDTLATRVTDAAGQPIPTDSVLIAYRSSDTTTAVIDAATGVFTGVFPGRVKFTASATAFGVTQADTVEYRIGSPLLAFVFFDVDPVDSSRNIAPQPKVTLGVGGTVAWLSGFYVKTPYAGIFEDPTHVGQVDLADPVLVRYGLAMGFVGPSCATPETGDCGSGNFTSPSLVPAFRTFKVPGTYRYADANGVGGEVVIVEEP